MKFSRLSVFFTTVILCGMSVTSVKKKSEWFKPGQLPQILKEVESKYAAAETLTAHFEQSSESLATKLVKKSSGTIKIQRPNKVRWETVEPDRSLLVSDGIKAWFYTPPFDPSENGQVIERSAKQIQSQMANALLSGAFSIAKDMKIEAKGAFLFSLVPTKTKGSGTLKSATIDIDPNTRLIRRIELIHKAGNRTEISLSEIVLGVSLSKETFTFNPPPRTDKIKE